MEALAIVGFLGGKSIAENRDILVQKVGERAAATKVTVVIKSEAADGLLKISCVDNYGVLK